MPQKKKQNSGKPKRVIKLSPSRPEARDEGPRLIPLEVKSHTDQFGRRALELADVALGLRPPAEPKRTPKKK
jgi:hypothetical protein